MEITAAELWSRTLQALQGRLPEQTFRAWLMGTRPKLLTDHELVVETPTPFHAEWLTEKYRTLVEAATRQILGRALTVSFLPGEGPLEARPPRVTVSPASYFPGSGSLGPSPPTGHTPPPTPGIPLNPRYTFDRFVVGAGNQLAAAAAVAVAEKPARMYNPLFLYGGVGLGKTHLMHAVGHAVLAANPKKRVAYVPTEQFMNELVGSIQEGTTPHFRRRYREIDILLVDDVHFLEGKERTQEEFFHTFNALYDAQKQIVLTSDRPPKELPGLEERLVSRFEWGLVADIQPPDYETRVAILRKKAADDSLTLDPEVIDFIARFCTSSVRELEGAIIKLLAYSSLKNQEVTLAMAQAVLQGILSSNGQTRSVPPSPEQIRAAVAAHFGISVGELVGPRRTRNLTLPRQVAIYLLRELTGLSLTQIGALVGNRDHSTVLHSLRKIEESLTREPTLRRHLEAIRARLAAR